MKKVLLFSLTVFLFAACAKSNKKFIVDNSKIVAELPTAGKDEKGCVTGNCAGTLCQVSSGNTCTKIMSCTAIPGGCSTIKSDIMSNLDLYCSQHADELLAAGIINEAN